MKIKVDSALKALASLHDEKKRDHQTLAIDNFSQCNSVHVGYCYAHHCKSNEGAYRWVGYAGHSASFQVFDKEIGYKATGGMLFFGFFAFAAFTPIFFTFSVSVIRFDVFCVFVAVIYVIIHRNELPDWIRWLIKGT